MNLLKSVNYKDLSLILLFELGFGIKFNLVGEISISEIFLVFYFGSHFFSDKIRYNEEFRHILNLYLCLFLSQCLSEIMVQNNLNNSLKGIAVTIMSFLHFYFLITMFKKSTLLAMWALVGMLFQRFLFGGSIEGDAAEALSGEDATFLKFYIAPIITYIILIYSVISHKKTTCILFMWLGMFFVIFGARSSGGIVFLTGFISWIISSKKKISKDSVYKYLCTVLVIGYGSYAIYVSNVLSGNIKSGNNEQLLMAEEPYNPINLLMLGRAETFAGIQAFMDAPLWGHGSWKLDSETGYKYTQLVVNLHKSDPSKRIILKEMDRIPCHSVLVGWGTYNGILAFLFGLMLIIYIYRRGAKALSLNDPMSMLLLFCLLQGMWHVAFSPPSHFRYTLPLYMALFVVSYWKSKDAAMYKNNNFQHKWLGICK